MPKIKTNDIETYYEIQGEGPPLVLIPGLGECHKLWQPQIGEFSRHFKVVVYDIRGHGESGNSKGEYSIKLFTSDLKALLDGLKIKEAHVCGFSLGGQIAQQFTIDYPTMVDKLVLVDCLCTLGLRGKIFMSFYRVLNRIVGMEQSEKIGTKVVFRKKGQEELRDFHIKEVNKISKEELFKGFDAAYSFDSVKVLKLIESPTLIIVGEESKYSHVSAKIMHQEIKNSQMKVISDALHVINLEKPDEFNKLVLNFLSGARE